MESIVVGGGIPGPYNRSDNLYAYVDITGRLTFHFETTCNGSPGKSGRTSIQDLPGRFSSTSRHQLVIC